MENKRYSRRYVKNTEQEKDMSERWLLTYADMITLLLGLFIIMYSISNVDAGKLRSVAAIIRGGFGLDEMGESLVMDGTSGIIQDKDLAPKSIVYRLFEKLQVIAKKILVPDKIQIKINNREELTLSIPASSLGEGKIKLSKESDELLSKIAEMDKDLPLEVIIRVQIPYLEEIDKQNFENNWAFTAYRGSLLARHIAKKYGIPESRILVQGMSDFQKLKETDSLEEKASQERVEIMIRKKE